MTEIESMSTYDNHVVAQSNNVQMGAAVARRLMRLSARAELAQEAYQREQTALIEMVTSLFEDAGLPYSPSDRFSIDWRTNTLVLQQREE